jgi:hypothetical protein
MRTLKRPSRTRRDKGELLSAGRLSMKIDLLALLKVAFGTAVVCLLIAGCLSDLEIEDRYYSDLSRNYRPHTELRPTTANVTVVRPATDKEEQDLVDRLYYSKSTLVGWSQVSGIIPKTDNSLKKKAQEYGANVVVARLAPMERFDSPFVYRYAFWSTKVKSTEPIVAPRIDPGLLWKWTHPGQTFKQPALPTPSPPF